MSHHPAALYNDTHQARSKAPTSYESLLGDAIERAFGSGIHDLDALVQYLNTAGPSGPNGQAWTAETYQQEMARLASA
jgi:hypothetical protein